MVGGSIATTYRCTHNKLSSQLFQLLELPRANHEEVVGIMPHLLLFNFYTVEQSDLFDHKETTVGNRRYRSIPSICF